MSRGKQGIKTGREERHRASQKALKERKKLRKQRAEVHAAMSEAARMKRSKKRGTHDFEENMRQLGYKPRERMTGRGTEFGRSIPGDILEKYEVREEMTS